jgi:putative transposase
VLLPDHLHLLCGLPAGDIDYSGRIAQIKKRFTRAFLSAGGAEGAATTSRTRHRVRGVWEKRFWEHTIRDYRDYVLHLEYIHMNPVKHSLAARAFDWPWSSFRRYVRMGWYPEDWSGPLHVPGAEYIEPW